MFHPGVYCRFLLFSLVDIKKMIRSPAASTPARRSSNRQRRRRKRKAATLSTVQAEEAAKQVEYLDNNEVTGPYKRRMQLKLQEVVEHCQGNDAAGHYLKECEDAPPGWDNDFMLDLDAIEANEEGFAEQVKLFLCSLKHSNLKNKDGSPLHKRHNSLKNYRTAINNFYKDNNRAIPPILNMKLQRLLKSKKKHEQRLKADGTIPSDSGRAEMTFALYRKLAKYFLLKGDLFSHLFLLLCWNTMVRNCNTDDLVFLNITWLGDCLGISIKRTKTNPDGSKEVQETIKHIYANPMMPEICPILGLAMYLAKFPFVGATHQSKDLFPGSNTQTAFNESVTKALKV